MSTPVYTNGVLDLRRAEVIPLIKLNLIIGDTFIWRIGVKEKGIDYTDSTAAIYLYDGKPPNGSNLYVREGIQMEDIYIPASLEEDGSASFTIKIPSSVTSVYSNYPTIYGACRLLRPDDTLSTIFTIQATTILT